MDYIYEDEMKNLFIEGTVPDKNEAPRYIEMLRRVKSYEVLMFCLQKRNFIRLLIFLVQYVNYIVEWILYAISLLSTKIH